MGVLRVPGVDDASIDVLRIRAERHGGSAEAEIA
jgi:plasmid stability protein